MLISFVGFVSPCEGACFCSPLLLLVPTGGLGFPLKTLAPYAKLAVFSRVAVAFGRKTRALPTLFAPKATPTSQGACLLCFVVSYCLALRFKRFAFWQLSLQKCRFQPSPPVGLLLRCGAVKQAPSQGVCVQAVCIYICEFTFVKWFTFVTTGFGCGRSVLCKRPPSKTGVIITRLPLETLVSC